MENSDVRHTGRVNAGVPPPRYGSPVEGPPQRKVTTKGLSKSALADSRSLVSTKSHLTRRSSGSSSKTVKSQQRRIDEDANQAILDLEEAQLQRERDLAMMKNQEESLSKKIQRLKDQYEDSETPDETKDDLIAQRKGLEKDLEDLWMDLDRAKVEVEFDNKSTELQKKRIEQKATSEKNQLEDESGEEEQDEVFEIVDKTESTEQWAATNANQVKGGADGMYFEQIMKAIQAGMISTSLPTLFPSATPPIIPPTSTYVNPVWSTTNVPISTPQSTPTLPFNPWSPPPVTSTSNQFYQTMGVTQPSVQIPLTSLSPPQPPPPVTSVADGGNPMSSSQSQSSPAMGQLEHMVRNMMSRCTPAQPVLSSTDKILARQVQGRDLPTFHGRPEEWPAFIVAYTNSTQFCQYSPAENLIRLQKCLKGEALRTVQCLLVSPDSVPAVIEKLRMRFGRPDQIIESLISKARELPPVKIEKLDSLVDLGIAVDNLASIIKSLQCWEHLCNPMLIKELVKKLPNSNQLDWARHLQLSNRNTPTLDFFAEWLNIYANAASLICPLRVKNDEGQDKRKKPPYDRILTTEEEPKSRRNSRPKDNQMKCQCCKDSAHKIYSCPKFDKEDIDERWNMVKAKRLCFRCLGFGHSSQDCKSRRNCGKDGCDKPHHRLLHRATPQRQATTGQVKRNEETDGATGSNGTVPQEMVTVAEEFQFINLMVLPVVLQGPKRTINTFAMLDCGATITVIESSIANYLGLEGTQRPLSFGGFQSAPTTVKSKIVSCIIKSADGNFSQPLNNVKTIDKLQLRQQSVRRSLIHKWAHLQDINLEIYDDKRPGILIGMDNPSLFLQTDHRIGNGNAPVAVKTPLGWTLTGRTSWSSREQFGYHLQEVDPLHQLVKEQFTTESLGVKPMLEKPRSKDDKRAQEIMDSSIIRVVGGWETALLWREDSVRLPESRRNAQRRLVSMEKKMDQDPVFGQKYVDKINEYIHKGYARILSKEEAAVTSSKTNFIPHFMAYNPKKPGKLRFVFDAAAKNQGQCLNDHLLQGPDKLIPLPNILLKFRQRRVGFTADIEDMFHRVKVKKEDSQAQRFLWRGLDRHREPDVLEMGVLIFGATCSPTCAQEVKNRNAVEFKEEYPEASNSILNNHYVDDLLDCCDTEEESIRRFDEVRLIHSAGGFNLRNWLSSSPALMSHIPEELRANNMKDMQMGEDTVIERVLGLFWKPESDVFTFSLNFVKAREEILKGKKIPTKREMLSLVMSIYDPLGFLAVLTIKAKILLQQAWRCELGWDDEIPRSTFDIWKAWLLDVHQIPTFLLPRCYSWNFSSADEVQLHLFVDASEEAFGAVGYFRIKKNQDLTIVLVMSKAKVAPLKSLSIPRMELQAALMGCRLSKYISEVHDVKMDRIVFWSDNTTVLGWINSDGRSYLQFVANRVGEIQELSNPCQWKWVPTLENVADELTRLHSPTNFQPSSRWITGPKFLQEEEEFWPQPTWSDRTPPEEEMRKNAILHLQEVIPLFDIKRFSKWTRLIRTTAYVIRYCNIVSGQKFGVQQSGELSPEEVMRAQKYWWKVAQQESFTNEWEDLVSGADSVPKNSKLAKLCPYVDEHGIIRAKGRIDNASQVDVSVRRPVILDSSHANTRLLIQHFHEKCGHHGTEKIVNEIRQQFYIPHLRSAVKRAYLQCQQCKNMKVKPTNPQMGQLPESRLEGHVIPFHRTGLDYFGPIEVVVKRSREKRYGALFTCLATRAVHLEVANSLTTDSCIMAIRRFVGRRGCPAHIYSDNGTNFVGAKNELQSALLELNQTELESECTAKGMTWHFNPPAAPHMGGSWERMVRSVKIALGSALKDKNLKDEVLQTLMVEAEHVVNSHPLTHVSIDPDDPEALTPNHFLIGKSSNLQPTGTFSTSDLTCRKQWRVTQELANQFWRRWVHEYLPTLLKREKWFAPTKPIQVGDVVVEVNQSLERNQWPLGIVDKIYPGRDEIVRVVDVKMPNGKVYKRPVTKLCVLDVKDKTATSDVKDDARL